MVSKLLIILLAIKSNLLCFRKTCHLYWLVICTLSFCLLKTSRPNSWIA